MQEDGAALAQGQRRVREGRPKERQGLRGREGARIEAGDTEKDGEKRVRDSEKEKRTKRKEKGTLGKKEEQGGRLRRRGQKNKENKRNSKEQTLLLIYKNSPARLSSGSAPRGGRGSRSRAEDPGGPGEERSLRTPRSRPCRRRTRLQVEVPGREAHRSSCPWKQWTFCVGCHPGAMAGRGWVNKRRTALSWARTGPLELPAPARREARTRGGQALAD